MSNQLKNLHYSEAGKSPRLSDLGIPKEPKPAQMPTRFLQQIYRNVDKALNYDPARKNKPRYDLVIKNLVCEQNTGAQMTAIQKIRANKKELRALEKP